MIYEYIEIGRFKKTTGLSGELIVEILDQFQEDVFKAPALFHVQQGTHVPYFVEELEIDQGIARVKFEDLDSPEAAAELSGSSCYLRTIDINADSLVDEKHPLLGYAIHAHGTSYGIIAEVHNYPQGEMAEVIWKDKSWMFPLVDAFVVDIKEDTKELEISFPEGYIDTFILPNS